MPYYNRDPKGDHNFDIHPIVTVMKGKKCQAEAKEEELQQGIDVLKTTELLACGIQVKPKGCGFGGV